MNELKQEGMGLKERIIKGTKERIRPIFLTASTDILGFLPMAISTSSGAEVQRPLATVVIGGMLTASILTLIIIPILYSIVEVRAERKKLKRDSNEGLNIGGASIATLLIIPLIGTLTLFGQNVQAQTSNAKQLTLDEAISFGLSNNGNVKSAETEIKRLEALKGTSFNLGKTDVGVQYGQYNSFENDFAFSIDQKFQFPTVYSSRNGLAKANIQAGKFDKAITENELIKEIKLSWYQLTYLMDKNKLLLYQDSMYVKFLKAANLRYQTEAGTLLEKVTAESKVTAVKALIIQNEADIKGYKKRLQTLLNSPSPVDIINGFNPKKELKLTLDTAIVSSNPNLGYLTNLITIREKEKAVNKAQFLPDFSIGYFNQSLIGSYNVNGSEQFYGRSQRFTGIQATISIPIWAKPDLARIKAAKLNQQKAQTEADYYQTVLLGEYERVVQDYLKYKYTIETYETNALPQAELILSNSTKSFENGAIDYVEYIQGLNNGLEIKNEYLNILNQYNQSIIAIEYLGGK